MRSRHVIPFLLLAIVGAGVLFVRLPGGRSEAAPMPSDDPGRRMEAPPPAGDFAEEEDPGPDVAPAATVGDLSPKPSDSHCLMQVNVQDEVGRPFPSARVTVGPGADLTAATDADGRAVFDLAAGFATVAVEADGYCRERRDGIACAPGHPAVVAIQLLPEARAVIRVEDGDRRAVPEAVVTVTAVPLYQILERLGSARLDEKTTDADGDATFESLAPGTWWVRIVAAGFTVHEEPFRLLAREREKSVTMTLEAGMPVRVLVRSADTGEPLPGVVVRGQWQGGNDPRLFGYGIGFLRTDGRGEIRFSRPAGVGVSLWIPNDPRWSGSVIGSRNETELVIDAVGGAPVACVLLVEGARHVGPALLDLRDHGSDFARSETVTADTGGLYSVGFQGHRNAPVFRFQVAGRGASEWRSFRSRARIPATPLVVEIRSENQVVGRVVDRDGRPAAGVLLETCDMVPMGTEGPDFSQPAREKGFTRRRVLSGIDGSFDLTLPIGDQFRIRFEGGVDGSACAWVDTIGRSGATIDLGTVRLPGTGVVRVPVTFDGAIDPFSYVWLEGVVVEGHLRVQLLGRTRHDGVAEFPRVPPGAWRIWRAGPLPDPPASVSSRMWFEVPVQVTAGATVEQPLAVRSGFWPR